MSVERYGHEYLYRDGSVKKGRQADPEWLVESYIVENDGHSFMSRGSQRQLVVRVSSKANPKTLTEAIEETELSSSIVGILQEMLTNGKFGVKSISY